MKDRRPSNKLKQKQLETKYLEEQTKKMEDKLTELKKQIEEQKKLKAEMGLDSTVTRWQKTAKTTAPLKSYAKQILEEQKQAHRQFGINSKGITGTKTFQGVLKQLKSQKQQEEERNPTKITTFLQQTQVRGEEPPKTVLEGNFFKAKMDVKKLIKQKTLQEFLEENYILEYLPALQAEEIVDLEGLRYVTRQKLGFMGVKAGHQIKIVKKIKQQFDKLLQGKYEQPEMPKQPSSKVQNGYGEGDINTYDSVQQPAELNHDHERPKSEDSEGQAQDEYQDQVLITVPLQSVELQAEYPRQNCFECYKLIFSTEFQFQQKYFCSEICMETYLSQLRKTCPACGDSFIKTQGYRQEGLWFCSLGCCPNHQQIEDLFFQWHRQRQ